MICPYCGKEMNEAYVQSAQQLYLNKGRKPRAFASGDLSSISLSKFSLTKAPYVKANYCADCRKIIIDLDKESTEKKLFRKNSHKL